MPSSVSRSAPSFTQLVVGFTFLNWGGTDSGGDLRGYVDASLMLLHGKGFYLPRQLHGPYQTALDGVLYPPTALYVFGPEAFFHRNRARVVRQLIARYASRAARFASCSRARRSFISAIRCCT